MAESIDLKEPFTARPQQARADLLGMWAFLATEMMMFGGLFLTIAVYRYLYPGPLYEASQRLHMWMGGLNTGILLVSSLFVALAVVAAHRGHRREAVWELVGAALLGVSFLGIKGIEYLLEYRDGLMPGVGKPFPIAAEPARLFFNLYFAATGLHAVHLTIGIILVGGLALRVALGNLAVPARAEVVTVIGLYWHLVDVVWVFLFPALYLVPAPHG